MNCELKEKKCGGCPLLNMEYPAQLRAKEERVRRLLGQYAPVAPIRGMENPYHYRNKAVSTFARGKSGRLVSGIYAEGTHRVLPVESCLLQDEIIDKTIMCVRAAANFCKYEPYNEDRGTGLVRHVLVRRGHQSGQVMVVLVTGQAMLPGAKNFVAKLRTLAHNQNIEITTVVQNVNDRPTSVVLGEREKVLYGKGFLVDTLCGKTFAISPGSFYQVNSVQTELLYSLAIQAAGLTGTENVIDAYCGIGTIALAAAPHAKTVTGVELNSAAVSDAIGNAKHNCVTNARFYADDATDWLLRQAAAGRTADVLFVDPPRAGSTPEFLASVAKMAPRTVVYVSCEPETLARDVEILVKNGYRAEGFTPVDMFPHTNHVEVICCLSRE